MDYDLMISQCNEHNEINLILSKKMNIKKIIIICQPNKKEKLNYIKKVYTKFLPDCIVLDSIIEEGNCAKIINLLEKYKNNKVLINLNNDSQINSFILLNEAYKYDMRCIYIDLVNKKRYIFEKGVEVIEEILEDINIEVMAEFSGNKISNDNEELASRQDLIEISKTICKNLELWKAHKNKLFDKNIMVHSKINDRELCINIDKLNSSELKLLEIIIKKLKILKEIDYKKYENKVYIEFQNDYFKTFIFKIGTWLEVLTHTVMREIKDIDEVKNSVKFYWNLDNKQIKNELDVLAIKDCIMICISCKDSNRYDEEALNELEVYSEKIGGEDAIKVLVATDYPKKSSVTERAKEMGIHLVIVDEDIKEFKNKLIRIIEKKQ